MKGGTDLGVTVAWDEPGGSSRAVVVLAHGAGGDLNDSLLRGLGERAAANGIAVARFNFPYKEAGRRAPGAQKQSEDCYRTVAEACRRPGQRLFCGGKSYGGRMATHIAAAGAEMDGLVLFSYPLHPPGRHDRLRDEHLPAIEVPMLICQGTKDPFARPDLLEATLDRLPNVTFHLVEGGDHSMRVRGKSSSNVYDELAATLVAFVDDNS